DTISILYLSFFQAEDGIRDLIVTGVQTCALPIWLRSKPMGFLPRLKRKSKPAAANWSCWNLMLNGFQNASKIPELRRRVLFTLAMLAVYRLGVHVPTPGIDRQALAAYFEQVKGTIFGLFNLFSGGALEQFSVFSLGIMPYISASIILQLLTVVFPYIERLSKEGEAGRRKITQYTRYGTVVLSIIQGLMISFGLEGTR